SASRSSTTVGRAVRRHQRLGGILNYCERAAAWPHADRPLEHYGVNAVRSSNLPAPVCAGTIATTAAFSLSSILPSATSDARFFATSSDNAHGAGASLPSVFIPALSPKKRTPLTRYAVLPPVWPG